MIEFHKLSQSAGSSPRPAARSVAASSPPVSTGDAAAGRSFFKSVLATAMASISPGRLWDREGRVTASNAPPSPNPLFQNRFISASKRLLTSAISAFEGRKLAQALFDIFALLFWAAFGALLGCAVLWSFATLFFVRVA